ncbi:hypothetical protein ACFW04_006896 [Cataglyphis niger]
MIPGSDIYAAAVASGCSLVYWNCRGVLNKKTDIEKLAEAHEIIILAETCLTPSHDFRIRGFSCERKDCTKPGMRGVAVLIKSSITYIILNLPEVLDLSIETITIRLLTHLGKLIVTGIYRHPNTPTSIITILKILNLVNSHRFSSVIADTINLNNAVLLNPNVPTFIAHPTRTSTLIDLAIASAGVIPLCHCNVIGDSLSSDHLPINVFFNCLINFTNIFSDKLKISKKQCKFTLIYCETPRLPYNYFYKQLLDIFNKYSPFPKASLIKKFCTSNELLVNSPPAPWWTKKCSEVVEKRKKCAKINTCRKILKNVKKSSWIIYCSGMNSRTSTPKIWRMLKKFRNRPCSLQNIIVLERDEVSDNGPHVWINSPFVFNELKVALNSTKLSSSPGQFPAEWCHSLVFLIPKPHGGEVRPIAFTSCILKTVEKLILNRLYWYIESNNILSCQDNLSILASNVFLGFLQDRVTTTVFIDIKAAFDNVLPYILIEDLKNLKLPPKTIKFIENLISARTAQFVIQGQFSSPLLSSKRTPQGSVLSPTLFNLYLREISIVLDRHTKILQFADDIIIFSMSSNAEKARKSVELSLSSIDSLLQSKGLDISPHKTQLIIFSRRNIRPTTDYITLNDFIIKSTQVVRFLGVLLDFRLNGNVHMNYIINKSRKIIEIIYEESSIEYACHIFTLKDSPRFHKLKRIQNKAVRLCLGSLLHTN